MLSGFKSFLMQCDLIVIAVGLVVALAFSSLIKALRQEQARNNCLVASRRTATATSCG
jgi:large-conductance mechanosensitive channel